MAIEFDKFNEYMDLEQQYKPFAKKGLEFLSRYLDLNDKNFKITSSSGNAIIIIPKELSRVIYIPITIEMYNNILNFCMKLSSLSYDERVKYFIPCSSNFICETDSCTQDTEVDIKLIFFKKITPLKKIERGEVILNKKLINKDTLISDTINILDFLAENNIVHGDLSLDNMGIIFFNDTGNEIYPNEQDIEKLILNRKNHQYVCYDYETAKYDLDSFDPDKDFNSIQKSFEYNGLNLLSN